MGVLDAPVLPLATDVLPVAEGFRHAVLRAFQRGCHRRKFGQAHGPYLEQFRSPVLAGGGLRRVQFQRFRAKPGDDGGRRFAGMFRITFARLVRGPLALGHSCHFGVGLFVPAKTGVGAQAGSPARFAPRARGCLKLPAAALRAEALSQLGVTLSCIATSLSQVPSTFALELYGE